MTLRDRIARALCKAQDLDWDAQAHFMTSALGGDNEQEAFFAMADAVLSALPCTLSQLEMIESGEMVVVPKAPTDAMVEAGLANDYGRTLGDRINNAYVDMLAARPKG